MKAEISDRRYEAARSEAARQAEERKRNSLAEADAARAVLAEYIPEIGAALSVALP